MTTPSWDEKQSSTLSDWWQTGIQIWRHRGVNVWSIWSREKHRQTYQRMTCLSSSFRAFLLLLLQLYLTWYSSPLGYEHSSQARPIWHKTSSDVHRHQKLLLLTNGPMIFLFQKNRSSALCHIGKRRGWWCWPRGVGTDDWWDWPRDGKRPAGPAWYIIRKALIPYMYVIRPRIASLLSCW